MLTRDLDKAREAYQKRDTELARLAHQGEALEAHTNEQGQYIKSIVYGGLDGIITTFAVVAGVAGAALTVNIVLIMGFANLIADGLSMAIGDFLSTKAEREYNRAERDREEWEVEHYPEGEKQEMVELYIAKGLTEADARTMAEIISKNKRAWVNIMMVEELGIVETEQSPLKSALATFLSFACFGFIPLLSYSLSFLIPQFRANPFFSACLLTGLTLFGLGAIKVKFTGKNWLASGLEMLLVGGIAAAAAYGVGLALSGLG